jgi:hypothetical protein
VDCSCKGFEGFWAGVAQNKNKQVMGRTCSMRASCCLMCGGPGMAALPTLCDAWRVNSGSLTR